MDDELIIDSAPGKNLISPIIENTLFKDLNEFYKIRVDYFGYPLIHDHFFTYGIFYDFKNQIPEDKALISMLIDYSITIAEKESDKKFINAIFLIYNLCDIAKKDGLSPSLTQIEKISKLKDRVQKLSFLSNITTFWEQILDFLSKELTFKKSDLLVGRNDYLLFHDKLFSSVDYDTEATCPVEYSKITKEIEGVQGKYKPLKFVLSANIENNKYWLWLYENISDNVWNWYIFVAQSETGETSIETQTYSYVLEKPEMLLPDYHYSI